MVKIKVECCEGNEQSNKCCLKSRCPMYRAVKENVDNSWPHRETGFGNLYSNPSHEMYLSEVKKIVSMKKKNKEEK